MTIDPYAFCMCGSGKKFKWCCQPIHGEIQKVFEVDEAGQHDTAMAMMDDLTKKHPQNPEVWGRKAVLLFQHERPEDAETTLEEAFKVNPNYAFGYYLRGQFRLYEGEIGGAILLFRKAVELYHPDAHAILHDLYAHIFEGEMQLQRPVAARAALELALKNAPQDAKLKEAFEVVFAETNPTLPASASRAYHFLPPADVSPERQDAWRKGLDNAQARLSQVVKAFEALSQRDDKDAAALYNLGLCHAWLGQNFPAVRALESYILLETDEAKSAQAWTLAEILKCGQGMTDHADYIDYTYVVPMKQPQAFVQFLGQVEQQGLLTGVRVDQERGVISGAVLEAAPVALTPELQSKQLLRIAAMFTLTGGMLQVWNTNQELLDKTINEWKQKIGPALGDPFSMPHPAKFNDVVTEALAFPQGAKAGADAIVIREHFEKYYEEKWLHQPRKSLGGVPPIDAAGHPQLRKKLLGIIQFIQECFALAKYPYDFDRLRRKLQLPTTGAAVSEIAATDKVDVEAMSAAELAGLDLEPLEDSQLEAAFQAAQKLDAREVAGRFAEALVTRPNRPERPDRYVWFNHLIQKSISGSDLDSALNWVNDGERHDCEHNEGKRRNDYELRRGVVHSKRGEHDQAQDVFDRLIQRDPSEMRYWTSAAETMLSAKQASRALRFAEAGLAEARKQNRRDHEGHLLELVDAAKRQGA